MFGGRVRWTFTGKLFPFILSAVLLFGCAKRAVIPEERPPVPPPPAPEAPAVPERPVAEPAPKPVPEKDPFEGISGKYRLKAVEEEKRRDWGKALLAWKVVHAFAPDDLGARSKIEHLSARITAEAERHFQRGVEFFQRNAGQSAGKEFAAALAHQPDHPAAIDYLGRILTEPELFEYQTVEGDTVADISRKIYEDPDLGFLVAYFNDLEARKPVRPGMIVKAPVLRPHLIARTAPKEVYRKPAAPSKPGKTTQPSPQEADRHYEKGLKYFMANDLEKAIQEWETTLQLNPAHPKANRDLDRAKKLRERLEPIRKPK